MDVFLTLNVPYENIKNALFFNILKYAWGLCLDKDVDTVMCVDEAHVLNTWSIVFHEGFQLL